MFGFLRSARKPDAPSLRQIGIDWGVESITAVLLDVEGHPLDLRNTQVIPEDPDEFQTLPALLADWPIPDSRIVMSLTRDYLIRTLDLPEVSRETIVAEVRQGLPYPSREAEFAWHSLSTQRTVAVAYPRSLLLTLSEILLPLGARSVQFEAIEFAQARLLESRQLPSALFTVYQDEVQFTLVSSTDFESLTQSTAFVGLEAMVQLGLARWKERGQEPPVKLVTNLSPDYLERLSDLPCERLEDEALAFHLALSPEGPHCFAALSQ